MRKIKSSVSKFLSVMLIASALLNVPACGTDPEGGPSPGGADRNSAQGRPGPVAATITFPAAGGSDVTFRLPVPERCLVLNASLQLDGQPVVPPPKERRCMPSDGQNSQAYEGMTSDTPPTGAPATFQAQKLDAQECLDASSEDGSTHATITYGVGSPYQLFRFRVYEDAITSITLRWVGLGYDWLVYYTDVQLYVYNSGRWESVGSCNEDGIGDYISFKRTLQPADGYVDAGGFVNLLALGPEGFMFCVLETDCVEATVLGSNRVWPSSLELDLGADGTAELQRTGELRGPLTVGSDLLREPLQAIIDTAGARQGALDVPVRFSSQTAGLLTVTGVVELDLPPDFAPIPNEKAVFEEDTEAAGLIDLDLYCRDDRDARVAYSFFLQPADGRIEGRLNADGHSLDFRSAVKDWYGTREFGIRATDSRGLDAVVIFNVTVLPVNDPPALYPVGDQVAWEDTPFTLSIRAFDVDDPPSNLSFWDDFSLFDVNPATGMISFIPTNEEVGRYTVRTGVRDTKGAGAENVFNLTIENINDPPVLDCVEELEAVEHQPFEYQPAAQDPDRGDSLTYSLESDIYGLEADPATGAISFTFGERDVGEHELLYTVTDSAGATDKREIWLVVRNVNDPPIMEPGGELRAVQGEYFEYRPNASDPDAGDELTFSLDSELLRIDERTGRMRFTPGNEDVGRHRLRVEVRDRAGLSAEAVYLLVVENVNDPPCQVGILSPKSGAVLREGEPLVLSGAALDPDAGDVLAFTWNEGGTLLGRGAQLTVILPAGDHTITLVVSDGALNASAEVRLTVVRPAAPAGGLTSALKIISVPAGILLVAGLAAAAVMRRRRRRGATGGGVPRPPAPPSPAPPRQAPENPGGEVRSQQASPPSPGNSPPAPQAQTQPAGGAAMSWPPPQNTPPPAQQAQTQPAGGAAMSWPPPQNTPPPVQQAQTQPAGGAAMSWPPPQAGHFPPQWPGPALYYPNYNPGPAAIGWPAPQFLPGGYGSPGAPNPAAGGPGPGSPQSQRPPFPPPPAELPPPPEGRSKRGGGQGETEPAPEPPEPSRSGRRGEVSREAVRAAINDAKHSIAAARTAGLNPSECERLLSEAQAASYRLDYNRARNLARRAEAVALSRLERAARVEDSRTGGDMHPSEEE